MVEDKPSEAQRVMLGVVLHDVLVEIRSLGWQGEAKQAADLADAVESLPTELFGIGVFQWLHTEKLLEIYQNKYPDRTRSNYAAEIRKIRRLVE